MHDVVTLHDLRIDAIIGLLDHERVTPQQVLWQVELEVPLEPAGDSGELARSFSYFEVQEWLIALTVEGRWRLLETVVLAAARLLLSEPAPCEVRCRALSVALQVQKPDVLDGAVPGVRLIRDAGWVAEAVSVAPGVLALPLASAPEGGAWKVVLAAGTRWSLPDGCRARDLAGQVRRAASAGMLLADEGAALLVFGPPGSL